MRTEQEWAKFARFVQPGTPVKWNITRGEADFWIRGSLVETYPHAEESRHAEMKKSDFWKDMLLNVTTLLVSRGGSRIEGSTPQPWNFNELYFWLEDEQAWYTMDDILMFDEDAMETCKICGRVNPPPWPIPCKCGFCKPMTEADEDQLTYEQILDDLAWEGCRLSVQHHADGGWSASIDRPETGYQRWATTERHTTEIAAVTDVYQQFAPYAMGGRDG